ncbi:MAG: bifunctional homocysteine S-methyltransferase/methylenetetrahydrofolate reductase [Armatimonadetes bacterium]|nr:bifunctional homocysteine S-methyltransferase/methylenetetrahydrofolate reductase [Armatimonadota bacterium]
MSATRMSNTLRRVLTLSRRIPREAAGPDRLVLGAMGPSGKHLAPIGTLDPAEAYAAFIEQAEALAAGDIDGFMLETFVDLEEIQLAVKAVRSVSKLPILLSKAFVEDGEALAEGLPSRVTKELDELDVDAFGANCVVGPQRMVDIVRQLADHTDKPVIAFPTPGLPQFVKGAIVYDTSPEYFAKATMQLVVEGATVIGGCCGTTPEHIRLMRQHLDKGKVKRAVRVTSTRGDVDRKPLASSEPTELSQKLGKKFVITVEMDLPRGLKVEKVIQGARALKIKGADVIDISDGARARLRMNPLSASKLIQDQVGIEVMMHFACRDRNLLAVQADLLGAHALGVRNILAITGDPANIGDYPSATSVFDVDSIGLVRILSRFNEGVDLAGYSVGVKCAFTIAIAFNPLAHDMDAEIDRLKRKIDAGAHIVYTQPIFEFEHIERTLEICQKAAIPLFVGVLPLRSSRQAEFLHNEVPGIDIPDWLRTKMANAPDEETALQMGIAEAQSLSARIKKTAQGLYLMPPFGNHAIAEQVMDAVL